MDELSRPTIKAYGFLESITFPEEDAGARGRVNIVIDSIKMNAVESGTARNRDAPDLLIVRILSTLNRLKSLFPEIIWNEGVWIQFELQYCPGSPPAWYLSAENAYSGPVVRTNIVSAVALSGRPSGSTPALDKLKELCEPSAAMRIQTQVGQVQVPPHVANTGPFVRVVDVGHASFSAIHQDKTVGSPVLGYFDVGGPVFFHHRTFPAIFQEASRVPTSGFVVLSHWDFDHYSLAMSQIPALRQLDWYAPDQPVGPNAASLQARLGSKLTLLSVLSYSVGPGLFLWKGTGTPTDRNSSGYVMQIIRVGGNVLLCGDMPYAMLPSGVGNQFAAITVTHHGGGFTGSPPSPLGSGSIAAVSYGIPNRYHHPNHVSIGLHRSGGWLIAPTYVTATNRGDVWL
ncbi:hypothetical protein [Pseudomonas cichorii]|uniref:hypothetical protein n=1 Tax=Pseudomonas cichorii TaxID=36746 RepID=UPI0019107B3B|nr:hypothetical protein [Pseudomonas cichorii]